MLADFEHVCHDCTFGRRGVIDVNTWSHGQESHFRYWGHLAGLSRLAGRMKFSCILTQLGLHEWKGKCLAQKRGGNLSLSLLGGSNIPSVTVQSRRDTGLLWTTPSCTYGERVNFLNPGTAKSGAPIGGPGNSHVGFVSRMPD